MEKEIKYVIEEDVAIAIKKVTGNISTAEL